MLSLVAAKLLVSPHGGKGISGPNTGARPGADGDSSAAVGQFDEALTSALQDVSGKDVSGPEPKASPARVPEAPRQSLAMAKAAPQLAGGEMVDDGTRDGVLAAAVIRTALSKLERTTELRKDIPAAGSGAAATSKSEKSGETQKKEPAVSIQAKDTSLPVPVVTTQAMPVAGPVPVNVPVSTSETVLPATLPKEGNTIRPVLLPSQAAAPSSEDVAMVLPAKPESRETEAFSLTLERKSTPGSLTNASAVKGSQKGGENPSDIPDQASKPAAVASSKATSGPMTSNASGTAASVAQRAGSPKFSGGDSGAEQRDKNEMPSPKAAGGDARESQQTFADYNSSPVFSVKDTKATGEARDAQPVTQPLALEKQDPTSGATKEVAIRLQNPSGETINVKLVDQGGQVQVTVRSSDPSTATSLRQDLSSLTNGLDRAGWKSDVSLPIGTAFEPVAQTRQADHSSQDSPSHRQAEWQQDTPRKRHSSSDAWDEMLTNQTA